MVCVQILRLFLIESWIFCWDSRCKKWPRSFGSMGLSMECLKVLLEPVLSMTSSNFLNTCNGSNDHWCRGSKSALTVIPARLVELVDLGREHAEFSLSLWVFFGCNASRPSMTWLLQRISSSHRSGVLYSWAPSCWCYSDHALNVYWMR